MTVRCLLGRPAPKSIAREGKMSAAGIEVGAMGLGVRGKEEFECAGFIDC
jgi:hypothetical protein